MHALEQFEDGTTAFFSARDSAWHNLGTVTADALTAQDALETAQLDWEVSFAPVYAQVVTDDGVTQVEVPNRRATVRNHPKKGISALGVVGMRYHILQNKDAFDFCNAIADESGAPFETAGSLGNGRRVFLTMKMPNDILVAGKDRVGMYLLVTNSHDGSSPVTVAVTPVRAVCANTVALALDEAVTTYKVRHTESIGGKVQEAREALAMTYRYTDAFAEQADALMAIEMSNADFGAYIDSLWERPADKADDEANRALTMWGNRRSDLLTLWNAPTQNGIRDTAWGAYNTVVEYVDWFAPVRGKGDKTAMRSERILDGSLNDIKTNAYRALVSA